LKRLFYKYQALGNDYIVIEPEDQWFKPEPQTIREICDRNMGVGSDGILYGPIVSDAGISLRIFNPDGSEAEKSGNGLRIFAHHIYIRGIISEQTFKINLNTSSVDIKILNEEASEIRVNMGRPSFEPQKLPMSSESEWINNGIETSRGTYNFTCLSIGNPHAVFFPDSWDDSLIHKVGPEIENNSLFPNRINVQMVRVIDRKTIEIRIWERGAGYTLASGSSSCASAFAAYYLKKVDKNIRVIMPGGKIQLEITDQNEILMTGHVKHVFNGEYGE
jgi:diaminopimelate epimerase